MSLQIKEFFNKYNNGEVCSLDKLLQEVITTFIWDENVFKVHGGAREELCSRCNKGHFSILAKQTRSADEGMTMFKCCNVCNYTTKC